MTSKNYLLQHLRQDGGQVVVFGISFLLLGLIPWLVMVPHQPSYDSLRFAAAVAMPIGLLAIGIGRGASCDPLSHHTVQDLARYGPVSEVLETLQRESETGTRFGRLCLSSNWLTACGVGITVVRLDDLAGVELGETRILVSGVIPAGSNWRLIVYTLDGRCLEFNCRNHFVATTLVALLLLRAPWAVSGPEAGRRFLQEGRAFLEEVNAQRLAFSGRQTCPPETN